MLMKELEQAMRAVEEKVFESPENLGCVDGALITRTHIHCARRFNRSINSGAYDLPHAMVLYDQALNHVVESEMAQSNAGETLIAAREREMTPRRTGPWTWEDVIKRSALPRNMPGIAIDTLGERVLQVGDQAVEYDEGEDTFRILGADGKVRTFPYEKLKTFRPSAFSGEKGIRRWEEGFKRRREVDQDAEGIMRQ